MIGAVRNAVRVNQLLAHSSKTSLVVSISGKSGSYRRWGGKSNFYTYDDIKTFSMANARIMSDFERCARLNSDKFVGIESYTDDGDLNGFFLLANPLSCNIDPTSSTIEPNDVY